MEVARGGNNDTAMEEDPLEDPLEFNLALSFLKDEGLEQLAKEMEREEM